MYEAVIDELKSYGVHTIILYEFFKNSLVV